MEAAGAVVTTSAASPKTEGAMSPPPSQGEPMASYFLFGAIGQCPQCGDHRFSGPALLAPDTSVTCHKCGHVCTVDTAVTTALKSGVVKKLSDHRVVQGS